MHVFVLLCLKKLKYYFCVIFLTIQFGQNPNEDEKKDKIPYFCIVSFFFFHSHTLPLSPKMFKVMCWLGVKLYPR